MILHVCYIFLANSNCEFYTHSSKTAHQTVTNSRDSSATRTWNSGLLHLAFSLANQQSGSQPADYKIWRLLVYRKQIRDIVEKLQERIVEECEWLLTSLSLTLLHETVLLSTQGGMCESKRWIFW